MRNELRLKVSKSSFVGEESVGNVEEFDVFCNKKSGEQNTFRDKRKTEQIDDDAISVSHGGEVAELTEHNTQQTWRSCREKCATLVGGISCRRQTNDDWDETSTDQRQGRYETDKHNVSRPKSSMNDANKPKK